MFSNLVSNPSIYRKLLVAWAANITISCPELSIGYIETSISCEPIYLTKDYGITCSLITTNGDNRILWDTFNTEKYCIYIFTPPVSNPVINNGASSD